MPNCSKCLYLARIGRPDIVKGMYPAPHIHEHFTIHKWLRQTAYNLNNLEHIANNCMNNAHWREHCAVLSTPRTVCRCTCVRTSHLWLKSRPVCHPCMRTCVWLLECSLFTRLSTSSSSSSSTSSWCPPWCLMRSPWKIPCATPASGAWSLWTMSHPKQIVSQERESRPISFQYPKRWCQILLNCEKQQFVSCTSNLLNQMYDFQKCTMFLQKWILNLQDLPRNRSLSTVPVCTV